MKNFQELSNMRQGLVESFGTEIEDRIIKTIKDTLDDLSKSITISNSEIQAKSFFNEIIKCVKEDINDLLQKETRLIFQFELVEKICSKLTEIQKNLMLYNNASDIFKVLNDSLNEYPKAKICSETKYDIVKNNSFYNSTALQIDKFEELVKIVDEDKNWYETGDGVLKKLYAVLLVDRVLTLKSALKKIKSEVNYNDNISHRKNEEEFNNLKHAIAPNYCTFDYSTDGVVLVKGPVVKVSQIKHEIEEHIRKVTKDNFIENIQNNGNFSIKKSPLVKIFSYGITIIDDDIKLPSTNLAIFTPDIYIKSDNFVIDLSGLNASNIFNVSAKNADFRAFQSGSNASYRQKEAAGYDGEPGMSGYHSGNLYIYARQELDGAKLKIYLNGGNGANGQNGENGANGNDAVDMNESVTGWGELVTRTLQEKGKIQSTYLETYELAQYGVQGGDGGKGGKGGDAGKSGKLTQAYKELNHILYKQDGQNGRDGDAGNGGRGGEDGDYIKTTRLFLTQSDSDGFLGKMGKGLVNFAAGAVDFTSSTVSGYMKLSNIFVGSAINIVGKVLPGKAIENFGSELISVGEEKESYIPGISIWKVVNSNDYQTRTLHRVIDKRADDGVSPIEKNQQFKNNSAYMLALKDLHAQGNILNCNIFQKEYIDYTKNIVSSLQPVQKDFLKDFVVETGLVELVGNDFMNELI